ncbi:MAG: iron ABC transporter permease [Myxococcota bacterium]
MKVLSARAAALRLVGLAGLLLFVVALGVIAGPSALHPGDAFRALFGSLEAPAIEDIVWRVRLPRVALAAVVGAALAVSGVLFQALLRNPLADPYVLGVSGGAAVGGILALSFGPALGWGASAVPPAAFAGALLTTATLYGVSGTGGRVSAHHLLLTGVVFNAFASAGIVFMASLSGLTEGTSLFLWLIGSLSSVRADAAPIVAGFLFLGLGCALPLLRDLNLLVLGEESAAQLGVEVGRLQRLLLLSTSLMVGAAVAVAGLVGFVGLIVPHLLRLRFGPDHRLLLPAAALSGAAFLVLSDTVARSAFGGRELPVGAITALVGGPLFLYLLRRNRAGSFPS